MSYSSKREDRFLYLVSSFQFSSVHPVSLCVCVRARACARVWVVRACICACVRPCVACCAHEHNCLCVVTIGLYFV